MGHAQPTTRAVKDLRLGLAGSYDRVYREREIEFTTLLGIIGGKKFG